MIAQHRENYNMQVRNYNKYIRKFPANLILNSMGYEKIESKYTEYKAKEDAPQNLFD
ncbi:lemA family protein [Clostridioides difficile 6057]|nr:lemA family protein [Clostridioides difficile 6057]